MRILWTKPAEQDFDAIWEYIEERNPAAAARAGEEILAAIERLTELPRYGRPGRIQGTRELIIARRPYIVIYSIEDTEVVIMRIIHGARRRPPRPSGDNK